MKPLKRLVNFVDDFINPITMKEMRQAVKGKFIVRILMLFLLLQLIVICVMLPYNGRLDPNRNLGSEAFKILLTILLFTCIILIPAYIGLRLSSELKQDNLDLLFVTSLSPGKIIRGKLSNGVILSLLFFSSSTPFMTLTYLLRGLDIPSMFLALSLDFMIVCIAVQFGILLGTLPGGMVSRSFRFLIAALLLFGVFSACLSMSTNMIRFGFGSFFGSSNTVSTSIFVIGMMLFTIVFFILIASAIISPENSNRSKPIRIFMAVVWTVSLLFCTFAAPSKSWKFIEPWGIIMTVVFCLSLIAGISERLNWSSRIKREIPKNPFLRILAFPFFSGAPNNIVFSSMMLTLTSVICYFYDFSRPHSSYRNHLGLSLAGLALYIFCYSMLALVIRRKLFPTVNGAKVGFTVIIVIIIAVVSSQLHPGFNYYSSKIMWWHFINPFIIFIKPSYKEAILSMISTMSLLLVVVNMHWFTNRFRRFVPPLKNNIQKGTM